MFQLEHHPQQSNKQLQPVIKEQKKKKKGIGRTVLHRCLVFIQAQSCAEHWYESLVAALHYLGYKISRPSVLPLIFASNSNEFHIKFPEVRREPGPQSLGTAQ